MSRKLSDIDFAYKMLQYEAFVHYYGDIVYNNKSYLVTCHYTIQDTLCYEKVIFLSSV